MFIINTADKYLNEIKEIIEELQQKCLKLESDLSKEKETSEYWKNQCYAIENNTENYTPITDDSFKLNEDGDLLKKTATKLIREAKKRAQNKGMVFDLTAEILLKLFYKQGCSCYLTGIPFDLNGSGNKEKWNPWQPSLDRINNHLGYTKKNVRLVCLAVNIALHRFGLKDFDYIVKKRHDILLAQKENAIQLELENAELMFNSLLNKIVSESSFSGLFSFKKNNGKQIRSLGDLRRDNIKVPKHTEKKVNEGIYRRYYNVRDFLLWALDNKLKLDIEAIFNCLMLTPHKKLTIYEALALEKKYKDWKGKVKNNV